MSYVYDSDEEFILLSKAIGLKPIPRSLQEALNFEEKHCWIAAIEKELGELNERGVFEYLDDNTDDGHSMKSKLFYKTKLDKDLSIVYKARLVACGYSQIFGIYYFDSFSPTTTTILFNIVILLLYVMLMVGLLLESMQEMHFSKLT